MWRKPACGLQKTSILKITIRHSAHSGVTEQSEGPLVYSASFLWHRLQDGFHYLLCYSFSSWKVPITERSIFETLCIRTSEWQKLRKKKFWPVNSKIQDDLIVFLVIFQREMKPDNNDKKHLQDKYNWSE